MAKVGLERWGNEVGQKMEWVKMKSFYLKEREVEGAYIGSLVFPADGRAIGWD